MAISLIRLTDYETGRPVLVNPDSIAVVVPRPACVSTVIPGKPPREHPERTVIDMLGGSAVVVRETSEEIEAAITKAKGGE